MQLWVSPIGTPKGQPLSMSFESATSFACAPNELTRCGIGSSSHLWNDGGFRGLRDVGLELLALKPRRNDRGRAWMVGGLKIILVKPGHEREFELLFGELRAKVRDNEPDCLLYSLLKSRTNPSSYIVQEQYR